MQQKSSAVQFFIFARQQRWRAAYHANLLPGLLLLYQILLITLD